MGRQPSLWTSRCPRLFLHTTEGDRRSHAVVLWCDVQTRLRERKVVAAELIPEHRVLAAYQSMSQRAPASPAAKRFGSLTRRAQTKPAPQWLAKSARAIAIEPNPAKLGSPLPPS